MPYIDVVIYGIFDTKNFRLVKVSLDQSEIQMDMSLMTENNNLSECEIPLAIFL
jgi:hypothetical protein